MTQVLRYGRSSTLALEIPPEALVADGTRVDGEILDDPAAAVVAALQDPMGYPPLARAVVPGDRVVIPVDPGVPRVPQVVAGVVRTLMSANVDPSDMVVLTARGPEPEAAWARDFPSAVMVSAHDPRDKAGLCYLAAAKDATPIYLNRHLCEADVIVPINLLRPRAALGYAGMHSGLFPTFSDEATRERFREPALATHATARKRRQDEADEVAWLLGLQLTVQIVAGPGNSVRHILAGLIQQVADPGSTLVEAAWSPPVPCKAALVVAAIAGEEYEQSWENFGRALYAACEVCADNGTIVLCTGLQCDPGPALKRLASYATDERLLQRLQHDRSEDAMSAALLLENRQRQHIYLLSDLDEGTVEALGVGYITTVEEIDRLGRHADSCILLADAHRAAPKIARLSRDEQPRRFA
jgi:nickel-dependent lactate racemase